MDYSKMSDRDIDRLVLQEIYGNQANDKDIICSWFRGGFKYTTNPADAWPIIAGNLIALRPVEQYVGGYRWFAKKGEGDFGAKYADENPLRAAMCLFLMMQESANVPANPAGPDIR